MVAAVKLAITGATGFVGGRLLDAAIDAGHEVRALTRRSMRPRVGVEWIEGALDDQAALDRLCKAVDAVIHVAGLLKGRTANEFGECNVEGTQRMVEAATKGGASRFVHVSSLAAREPDLSLYGASKSRSEAVMEASKLAWAIVRPPAVYGPGDKETLDLFRMAKAGLLLLPPAGQLSVLHVDDLARLLLALAQPSAPSGLIVEPDDGRPGGWTHREFGRELAQAAGRRGVALSIPSPLLRAGARIDQLVRGSRAKLTSDRAAYFCHPDWVADPARRAPPSLWTPQVPTTQGLADTYEWYSDQDWL